MRAFISHNTFFKKNSTNPAIDIPDSHKLFIRQGSTFEVLGYRDAGANHYTITFAEHLGGQKWNTWCVYKDHVQLIVPSDNASHPSNLHISDAGLKLIKEYEGFRSNAYKCPAGVWTIGYGSTAGVRPGQWISEADAEARLREEVKRYERGILAALTVDPTQNQFDALVSLAYNCGIRAIARSSVVKFHNRKEFDRAADAFLMWNRGGGVVLPGLTRRRREERSLYLK